MAARGRRHHIAAMSDEDSDPFEIAGLNDSFLMDDKELNAELAFQAQKRSLPSKR